MDMIHYIILGFFFNSTQWYGVGKAVMYTSIRTQEKINFPDNLSQFFLSLWPNDDSHISTAVHKSIPYWCWTALKRVEIMSETIYLLESGNNKVDYLLRKTYTITVYLSSWSECEHHHDIIIAFKTTTPLKATPSPKAKWSVALWNSTKSWIQARLSSLAVENYYQRRRMRKSNVFSKILYFFLSLSSVVIILCVNWY